jgi:arsenical-resistance protein 2
VLTSNRIGSSRGRGNRAAAWFADHIKEQSDENMQSLALEGGIKGWVAEKGRYLQYMQEYDESYW